MIFSGLFYDVVSTSDCVASVVGSMMNAELERIWQESVVDLLAWRDWEKPRETAGVAGDIPE